MKNIHKIDVWQYVFYFIYALVLFLTFAISLGIAYQMGIEACQNLFYNH